MVRDELSISHNLPEIPADLANLPFKQRLVLLKTYAKFVDDPNGAAGTTQQANRWRAVRQAVESGNITDFPDGTRRVRPRPGWGERFNRRVTGGGHTQ